LRHFEVETKELERALGSRSSSFGQLLFRSDILRSTSKAVFDSLCSSKSGNGSGRPSAAGHRSQSASAYLAGEKRQEGYIREIFSSALWVQRTGDPANKQFHARSHARSAIITLVLSQDWKGCVPHAQLEAFVQDCRNIDLDAQLAKEKANSAHGGNFASLAFQFLQQQMKPSTTAAPGSKEKFDPISTENSAHTVALLRSLVAASGSMHPGMLSPRHGFGRVPGEVTATRQMCRFLEALVGIRSGTNPADEGETESSTAGTPKFGQSAPSVHRSRNMPLATTNPVVRALALESLVNYSIALWDVNMVLRVAEHLSESYFCKLRERDSQSAGAQQQKRTRSGDLQRHLNGELSPSQSGKKSTPVLQQGDSNPSSNPKTDAEEIKRNTPKSSEHESETKPQDQKRKTAPEFSADGGGKSSDATVNLGCCVMQKAGLRIGPGHNNSNSSVVISLEVRRCHSFRKAGSTRKPATATPFKPGASATHIKADRAMANCVYTVVASQMQFVCSSGDLISQLVERVAEAVDHSPALTKLCFDGMCYPLQTRIADIDNVSAGSVEIVSVLFSPATCASIGGQSSFENLWLKPGSSSSRGVPAYAGDAVNVNGSQLDYEGMFGKSTDALEVDFRDALAACAERKSIQEGDAAVILFATALRMAQISLASPSLMLRPAATKQEPELPPRDDPSPKRGGEEPASKDQNVSSGGPNTRSRATWHVQDTSKPSSPVDVAGWHSILHVLVQSSAHLDQLLRNSDLHEPDVVELDTSLQLAAYSLQLVQNGQSLGRLRDLWTRTGELLRLQVLRSAILAIDFSNQCPGASESAVVSAVLALPRFRAYQAAWSGFLHDHFCFLLGNPLDCCSFLVGLIQSLHRASQSSEQSSEIPIYLFGRHVTQVRLTVSLLKLLEREINLLCLPEFWSQLFKYVYASSADELRGNVGRLEHVGSVLLTLVTSDSVWADAQIESSDVDSAKSQSQLSWSPMYKSTLLQGLMNLQRSLFGAMQHILLCDDEPIILIWQSVVNNLSRGFFTSLSTFLQQQDLGNVGQMLAVAMIWIFSVQQLHNFFEAHFFSDAAFCGSILKLLLVIKANASDRLMDAQCSLADVLSHTATEAILHTLNSKSSLDAGSDLLSDANNATSSGNPNSAKFVAEKLRNGSQHCADLWCLKPLFSGGLNPDHLRQHLLQQPATSSVHVLNSDDGLSNPTKLLLEAIDKDPLSAAGVQPSTNQIAHVKLALKLSHLSLNSKKSLKTSHGVALTLLRGAQEQVSTPSNDLQHILGNRYLESAVLHTFAVLLIHAVEDPLSSSYKLMMKSGTIAPGTAELLDCAIGFGLRVYREVIKAAEAAQAKQAQVAKKSKNNTEAASRPKARGGLLLARSQSDTSMALRHRIGKVVKVSR